MKVEVLYFEGCPNHPPALERIKEILREESCGAEVREILVLDVQAAQSAKFRVPGFADNSRQRIRYRADRTRATRLRFNVPKIFGWSPLP
jgi:hypothetical protein